MEISTVGSDTIKIVLSNSDLKKLSVCQNDEEYFIDYMLKKAGEVVDIEQFGDTLYVEIFEKNSGCIVYISGYKKKCLREYITIKCSSVMQTKEICDKIKYPLEIYADQNFFYILFVGGELNFPHCEIYKGKSYFMAVKEHCTFATNLKK